MLIHAVRGSQEYEWTWGCLLSVETLNTLSMINWCIPVNDTFKLKEQYWMEIKRPREKRKMVSCTSTSYFLDTSKIILFYYYYYFNFAILKMLPSPPPPCFNPPKKMFLKFLPKCLSRNTDQLSFFECAKAVAPGALVVQSWDSGLSANFVI